MSLNYDEIKEKIELEEIEKQKRCGEQRIERINRYKKHYGQISHYILIIWDSGK